MASVAADTSSPRLRRSRGGSSVAHVFARWLGLSLRRMARGRIEDDKATVARGREAFHIGRVFGHHRRAFAGAAGRT
jgi:hypothetical protein